MIVTQDENGWWTDGGDGHTLVNTHDPAKCANRLCDIHDRRGPQPYASWPLNWRGDRGIFEVICPHGVGHPSPAQVEWMHHTDYPGGDTTRHGCDGCCADIYTHLDNRTETP